MPCIRALCIVGSPHQNGSTARLVGQLVDELRAAGVEVVTHCLGDLDIRYCRGCKRCEQTGACWQLDDMPMLLSELMGADIVVLASPS